MNTFLIRDSLEETLDLLVPFQDDLTLKVEDIFATDQELRLETADVSDTGVGKVILPICLQRTAKIIYVRSCMML